MYKPSVTYRIQFNKDFNFKNLDEVIPYLSALGVDTIYASPIFTAIPGSTHGYDGVNPLQINPEIGTEAELFALSDKLRKLGIGWLQDIVPNHMAFHPHNVWLMDVLEHWDKSPYFSFFDLNFPTQLDDERLMVPFLGESLEEALSKGLIQLGNREGKIYLTYGDAYWPINELSLQTLLASRPSFGELLKSTQANTKSAKLKQELTAINEDQKLLTEVAKQQYYRLCNWQETEKQINYRRFFTVNGLICLNMQHKKVFDAYHQYIIQLTKKGVFQGLRIDHIDGLADPKTYLQRLRNAVGKDCYIVVEKILEAEEELPTDWPIDGTTGYDFLAIVNNLLTNRKAEKPFNKLYREMIDKNLDPSAQMILKKRGILLHYMQGELNHLVTLFLRLVANEKFDESTMKSIKTAIADFLIYCPVYRFYGNSLPLPDTELAEIRQLLDTIPVTTANSTGLDLLTTTLAKLGDEAQKELLQFYQRLMQFSGPLMAKGVEDTLMYTYNRFIGHGEVGDSPAAFGIATEDFHQLMMERQNKIPFSINATATHDTKRGEDVRARLNVLTDLPSDWRDLLMTLKGELGIGLGKKQQLHQNDIYLVLQTIIGVLPYAGQNGAVGERLNQYLEKALREAKKRSDWANPNQTYEQAVMAFAAKLLQPGQTSYRLIADFLEKTCVYSITNSLVQLLLKFTCPGIPDIYQGCELWDLSMVDPDNRRPVDYQLRSEWLQQAEDEKVTELWEDRESGRLKLALTQKLIAVRKTHHDLFNFGDYVPLEVNGKYKSNILAFMRQYKQQYLVVVVPLGFAKLNVKGKELTDFDWKDTTIIPPITAPHGWKNLLTKETGEQDVLGNGILVKDLFTTLPIALLELKNNQPDRGSGILLPLFSLPSQTGIGNLGKEAYQFIDFLAKSHQKYWQLLPLNPTTALQHYSPYSAFSAMAGNVLYIDPMFFVEKGWLKEEDLNPAIPLFADTVDYKHAEVYMSEILRKAYQNYNISPGGMQQEFSKFCNKEAYWLADFVVFTVLREKHNYLPWIEWPEVYKFKHSEAIEQFSNQEQEKITEVKWQQFIFHLQWQKLRDYANDKGVKLIGDLPFYVDHDSVDVWANPKVFLLNEQREMEVVAGVPPDIFNDDGQLWALPIFNWKHLKSTRYKWWIDRIKKNIELFDLVRLDHFRAFHSYWEIKATELTAKNGVWKAGPAEELLSVMCKTFDDRSLIVEDLGGDMEGPIKLREDFNLAGMRVLQFAFGCDVGSSSHTPHNYPDSNTVVYVGTHDNNTSKGWYLDEADVATRERLNLYVGKELTAENVAEELIKVALKSTAKIAIIQLQDVLNLGSEGRINTPATIGNNWLWRLKENGINEQHETWLRLQTQLFGRG